MFMMRGPSSLSFCLLSLIVTPGVFTLEQQPFEFGEMFAPQYTLPPLPYAYDVSLSFTLP
jgi:Fe-Mn family superoxide dismutase